MERLSNLPIFLYEQTFQNLPFHDKFVCFGIYALK